MRLMLLGSKDTIIEKNNSRRDFWRNIEGQRNEYDIKNLYK